MSSLNPHFTFEYSQPEEYRFSHDSVFMAREIFERYRDQNLSDFDGLDLCSGCGIIGLDFLFHLRNDKLALPRSFDFLEVQDVYQEHFFENVRRFGVCPTLLTYKGQNYETLLSSSQKYDLILCNPPYFHPHQGKLSPSEFKNRCRFYIDSTLEVLLLALEKSLKPGGRAYFLFREDARLNISDLRSDLQVPIDKAGDIRGTTLLMMTNVLAAT